MSDLVEWLERFAKQFTGATRGEMQRVAQEIEKLRGDLKERDAEANAYEKQLTETEAECLRLEKKNQAANGRAYKIAETASKLRAENTRLREGLEEIEQTRGHIYTVEDLKEMARHHLKTVPPPARQSLSNKRQDYESNHPDADKMLDAEANKPDSLSGEGLCDMCDGDGEVAVSVGSGPEGQDHIEKQPCPKCGLKKAECSLCGDSKIVEVHNKVTGEFISDTDCPKCGSDQPKEGE